MNLYTKRYGVFSEVHTYNLFEHIEMRKHKITFTIKNHLPTILPNQLYNAN